MADAIPDWAVDKPAVPDWAADKTIAPESAGTTLKRAFTDIPSEIYSAGAGALHEMNAVNPWGAERTAARAKGEPPGMMDVPRAVAGAAALPFSPSTGTVGSVGGHMLELLNRGMRDVAVRMYGEEKIRQVEAAHPEIARGATYEGAKADADALMMGLGPRGGMRPVVAAPAG